MYPSSSSSSSSHGSMGPGGLTRYSSAPGSLLSTAADSVIGPTREFSSLGSQKSLMGPPFFSGDTSDSTCKSPAGTTTSDAHMDPAANNNQKCYGMNEISVGDFLTASNFRSGGGGGGSGSSSSTPSLVRHSSSPAGFLSHLASTADNGFSLTTSVGSYNSSGASDGGRGISRLNSQLSFTRQDSLSLISEESDVDGINTDNGNRKNAHSYATASFGVGSWDETNNIIFSAPPSKRTKDISTNVVSGLDTGESQFQFGMSQTALEMATMENLLHIPQDSVPCKIRAKRGCATHPRSIAERERRTRISGKLKKLQDLVPNMDKQTSYSDMLDLAVQHIKGLQNQVRNLHNELENCTCGCKEDT